MGKANISFPEGMLEDIDERAAAAGMTRSAYVQEAAATYMAQRAYAMERSARQVRIERAIAGMHEIGASLPSGPDGVTLVRRTRDEVPEWLSDKSRGGDE